MHCRPSLNGQLVYIAPRSAFFFVSLLVLSVSSGLQAASLIHQFNLDSSLNDSLGTGVTLAVHPDTDTDSIGVDGWTWAATDAPGGGLILTTDSITDPLDYSLGFRVQFNEVASGGSGGGSQYRKLVSFQDATDDDGLYFKAANLVFYPFGVNADITYSANTFYDFVFARDGSDNTIRVYVVEGDGTVTKVYEESDTGQDAVPVDTGGGQYRFMLFMDDTHTTDEWTSGGICKSVRVWNGALSEQQAADALSDAATTDATAVSSTTATLNGTVSPKGTATTVTFEYGTTTAYGTTVTATESPVNSATVVTVSKSVTDLTAGTTYHYRVKAVNGGGTSYGADRTFTTSTTIECAVGSAAFTMGGAACVVDSALTIEGSTITGAKVSITTNFTSGDTLSYTGSLPGGVTASYSSTTGILTFSGSAAAADWQTLLRTVTFSSTAVSTSTRTVSFTLGTAIPFGDNGHFYEYVASANITWSSSKTAAEARTLFGLQGYLATITSQAENDFIRQKLGADAWIGGSDAASEDVWKWVSGPESGTQFSNDSVAEPGQFANWNAGEPNNCCGGEHYAEIYSTDGVGKWNDLTGASQLAGYVTEYGDMAGDPTVQITDSRNVTVSNASLPTVTTTAISSITTTSSSSGGNVTSDGGATVTARGVCWNTAGTPTTADDTLADASGGTGAFTSSLTSLSAGTTYYVRAYATNSVGTAYGSSVSFTTSTTVDTSAGSAVFTRGGGKVVVDSGLEVVGSTISGAKVSITENFTAGDVLSSMGELPAGVTASYNTTTGILTFSGSATAAEWQALLRTITFNATSTSLDTRTVSFTLGSAIPYSDNGHFYEYVASADIIWSDAKTAAENRMLFGLQGYLATITSQAENDFIRHKLGADAWIGGSDAAVEGVWRWVTGPEAGTQFADDNVSHDGEFANWNSGEPNNCCAGEHYAEIYSTDGVGKWNDLGAANELAGYVVEYGDMAGDPTVEISADKSVELLPADNGGPGGVIDQCPGDPNKTEAGVCGCGTADTDTDGDGTADCNDACPDDAAKTTPGSCGCGTSDSDNDGDGVPNCMDGCPDDPSKLKPGLFGCGASEADRDGDGVADITDGCPDDPRKTSPGALGCGVAETDSDQDGVPDSLDGCPDDPNKSRPGSLGCGIWESPDLQVTITLGLGPGGSGQASVIVGQELRSHVLVTNIGNGGATNVWVTIPLPPGMEFVGITIGLVEAGQGVPENVIVKSDRISFLVGDVPAGYQVAADLVLRANTSGELVLTPQTISEETPQPVTGAPAAAQVGDVYDRIVTTTTYPVLCGAAGATPLLLTMLMLGLLRRR